MEGIKMNKQKNLRNIAITEQIRVHANEGICVNCVHYKECTFPHARKNVQYCEEYE